MQAAVPGSWINAPVLRSRAKDATAPLSFAVTQTPWTEEERSASPASLVGGASFLRIGAYRIF